MQLFWQDTVLESYGWQIGKLILKGALNTEQEEEEEEEVDEVGTVSGISNYWRLEATPNQPPANSHLTVILNKTA